MSPKKSLKKIHVQSGVPDGLGREIQGLFTVLIDPRWLREQMERASKATGRRSKHGAVVVEFQQTSYPGQGESLARSFVPKNFEIRGDPRSEDFGK